MSSDGSSDAFGAIILAAIISVVLLIVISLGTWLHVRSEARKDADCDKRGGIRIEIGNKDHCIRKSAFIQPTAQPKR